MSSPKTSFYAKIIKRPFDFLLAMFAVIVLSPLIFLLAIIVRTKLGSPILYKQQRPGLDEKIFTLYKFRTMTNDKDSLGNLLPSDERLTKLGKILRSLSLDELPELFNILKGDMSIVGPRPLLIKYLPLYNSRQRLRHKVRPGLTGLAQISGRNLLSWEEKFELDVRYVETLSFFLDIKIIVKTFFKVFAREGINSHDDSIVKQFQGNKEEN